MNFRRNAVVLSGLLLLGGLFGCGSASNNDQGVSFLFTGFFPSSSSSTGSATGLTGLSVPLTNSNGNDNENAPFGGSVPAVIGLQNNLAGQGIQVQRVFLSFFIPGSAIQPPSTSYGLGMVLGPGSPSTIANPTTLPPGYNVGAAGKAEIPVLPFEVREWMAFNQVRLPEPPFALDVTAYATGITTAGDRLDTNQGLLTITITPAITIPPSSGDGGSGGSTGSTGAASGDGLGPQVGGDGVGGDGSVQ